MRIFIIGYSLDKNEENVYNGDSIIHKECLDYDKGAFV